MRLTFNTALFRTLRWARTRASAEHGFTMVVALGVLLVTSLLLTAVFYALQGEIHLGTDDLAAKRAYAAATAGVNAYLYNLNQNPNYWGTCSNDIQNSAVTVPSSSNGESYTFQPIYANGNTSCTSNVINSLVDNTTGTIRMVFNGSAGAHPVVTRSIVVSFRMNSPLDFLWYTNYEALDSTISGFSDCNVYYRTPRSDTNCNIYWVSGDVIKGPMYTNDQYLIQSGQSPTFGRAPSDKIESSEPLSGNNNICSGGSCGSANIKGTAVPDAPTVSTPSDNSELLADAQNYGMVYSGTTNITLNGTSATVQTCTTSAASSCSTTSTVDLTSKPIIYVNNATGCTPTAYTPFGAGYNKNSTNFYGCAGDVYVSGNYTTPVTIAAANNIIVDGNITTTTDGSGNPTGTSTLGLVANQFVRVMHGITGTNPGLGHGTCTATNNSTYTLTNPVIDAAILALDHSFIVDNFNCGATPGANGQPGTLTVDGAIAQDYRGAVGTGTASTGYLKNYSYDDRLANILPPYLFDISNSGWHISRETLCVTGSTTAGSGCAATS